MVDQWLTESSANSCPMVDQFPTIDQPFANGWQMVNQISKEKKRYFGFEKKKNEIGKQLTTMDEWLAYVWPMLDKLLSIGQLFAEHWPMVGQRLAIGKGGVHAQDSPKTRVASYL